MTAKEILDFIYLDLPRLESIASQLLEGGVPESATRSEDRESRFDGEASGGIPLVLKGSARAAAVLSAGSSVTSRYHHRLVVKVLERLRQAGFLRDLDDDLTDGAFVHITGELQVVDPRMLARFMEAAPDLQKAASAFTESEPQARSRAERRTGRGAAEQVTGWPARRQTDAMKQFLDVFAADSARVRVIVNDRTVAVGVVEREKFVEDLERLIGRHGQLFGGTWSVLGQVNQPSDKSLQRSEGSNLFDLIESGGADLVETISQLSGTGAGGLRVTPLAIYRTIVAR